MGRFDGYSLSVGTAASETDLSAGGLGFLQRLRGMLAPSWGPFTLEVAYEHTLQLRQRETLVDESSTFVASTPTWLPLQWTIADEEHGTWRHRFDRLALAVDGSNWEAAVGRQTISWATTLFFTPADPFAPFDPADPFREYRAGVDAARFRLYPSALSEADFVIRPVDTDEGTEVTAVARFQTAIGSTGLSVWTGVVYGDPALSAAVSSSVGALELRSEASLRTHPSGGAALRASIGIDRRFGLWGRDLYAVLEYQHEDFGAGSSDEYLEVLQSKPFQLGEMQTLGKDEVALQGAYQIHPLWSVDLLTLVNVRDPSGLVVPAASYSAATDVMLRGGIFFSFGDASFAIPAGLGSEYGVASNTAYLSLSWFF